jgi:hypothetical protein
MDQRAQRLFDEQMQHELAIMRMSSNEIMRRLEKLGWEGCLLCLLHESEEMKEAHPRLSPWINHFLNIWIREGQ